MVRFVRDHYVWYIAIILSLLGTFTYIVEPNIFGKTLEESEWHLVYMTIRNFVFLGVVALSAWRFGFKGGLATGLVIGLIELPHMTGMFARAHHIDHLIEYAVFAPIGVAASWLIGVRKQTEETMKLQAELMDKGLDSVYLTDFEGNLIYVNKAAYVTHGYTREELLKMTLKNMDDLESAKLVASRLKEIFEKGEVTFEVNHLHRDGSLIPLEIHASKIEVNGKSVVLSVAHNITERRKLEQQLMAQDRLASIGQLVSGVAHELNNPLTSVIGFSELLLQRELPDDVKADLKIVNDEAKRTSLIVKNLLTFARQQPQDKRAIDINEPIKTVLQLRSHEHSINNIKVNVHFAPDLPQIMGNGSQLQQVFFNIVVNAEQAMLEAHKKGTLTITTERVENIVKARFTDDGPGISPENMKKLFTPFFTTKGVGKGTGLGLSICQGIITEHKGKIWAESEPGKRTTFIIELPVPNGAIS